MPERTSRPKIVLANLPHPLRPALNIPLAAGYLKAAAYKFGLLNEVDIEILPPLVASYFGCRMLVERIVALKPAILGFTLYLWNVERSLHIAREVKKRLPYIQVVVGGPEVSGAAVHLLSDSHIDIAVDGEGEITFVEIVRRFLHGRPQLSEISGVRYRRDDEIISTAPRREIPDMEIIPSPYLMGYIDPSQFPQMMIFTMRGCLQGCTYCSWSGRGRLRPFALERLEKELMLAMEADGMTRVGIWDSAFNLSPVFADVCKIIQKINSTRYLKFTCFLQADSVTEETARLLRQANFTYVDVGLQSSNPKVLSHIGRHSDLAKFVPGVRALEQEGIQVKVDTILGLPGDSLETFHDTMRFCAENRLDFRIFNLSLGYGTAMRRRQEEFGLKIQQGPPYVVRETPTFTHDELDKVRERHIELFIDVNKLVELGYPAIVSSLPLSFPESSHDSISALQDLEHPIRNIVLRMDGPPEISSMATAIAEVISKNVESRLTLLYLGNAQTLLHSVWLIRELLVKISTHNPYVICDVLLETDEGEVSQALLDNILSFVRTPLQFIDRQDELFSATSPVALRRRANVFVVTHDREGSTQESRADNSKWIKKATISARGPVRPQIQEIMKATARGFLIDFDSEAKIDLITNAMELLLESKKSVYFKDWVLQSIWEIEFNNLPSKIQSHYEVAIDQGLNVIDRFFDENELWLEKIKKGISIV
jgi:hypothetical protein